MPRLFWTRARIAELKRLWSAGQTAAAIGAALGGITRSRVLGKVFRLRLVAENGKRPAPAAGDAPARRRAGKSPPPKPAVAKSRRKTLLDLTNECCRWPYGELGGKRFFFCGEAGGHCEERKRRSNPDGSGKNKPDCFASARNDDKGSNSPSNASQALVAAYRDGLGLAAVTLVAGETGVRLMYSADEPVLGVDEAVQARWWCRSAQQAEWLVEAAVRAARRNDAASRLNQAVLQAARRLGITLRSDEEVARDAIAVVARLNQEIAAQQRAGGLKSVNRGYRDYRLAASARGEKVLRYADWMERYKAKLVRDIAQNLRSV